MVVVHTKVGYELRMRLADSHPDKADMARDKMSKALSSLNVYEFAAIMNLKLQKMSPNAELPLKKLK